MEYKDYYKILGVTKTATDKEIKAAYRRLARKHHPDVNPADKTAEKRFKEIGEAYEVLSDTDKRKRYDTLGPDWENQFASSGAARSPYGATYNWRSGTPGAGGSVDESGFSDFFETLFGNTNTRGGARPGAARPGARPGSGPTNGRGPTLNMRQQWQPRKGDDLEQGVEITLQEAYSGTTRLYTLQAQEICSFCHGSGVAATRVCTTCRGTGTTANSRRVEVKIPAGVETGAKVRVPGEGKPGVEGGPRGDFVVLATVLPDPLFERKGDDLTCDLPVELSAALLGGEAELRTMTSRVMVTIKPETQNGTVIRLTGKGMPKLKESGAGNLYARVKVMLPLNLTPEEREMFTKFQQGRVVVKSS